MENIDELLLKKLESLETKMQQLYEQINLHNGVLVRLERLESKDSALMKIFWIVASAFIGSLLTVLIKNALAN